MAGFSADRPLVDRARAATCDFAFRAGFPSRDGAEPDCGLVAETSRAALRWRDPADARTDRDHYYDRRLCDSAASQANPGTGAQRAECLARHSDPYRIDHAKLSDSPRRIAAHR